MNMFWRHKKRCLSFVLAVFIIFVWVYSITSGVTQKNKLSFLKLPYVVVHLDLKGMPPKMSYLKSLLPKMRKLGANALLMEYEDMFPYEGMIRNLSSRFAYNKEELSEFLSEAHDFGFEIIPLVQTFGHLEFALKLPEFWHLRENPFSPESICPSNNESHALITNMLQQIIVFHNNISPLKHIHIGCDEVLNMNLCEYCKKRKMSIVELFVDHVNYVHRIIKNIFPSLTILIWDDMIRKRISDQKIDDLEHVEPVYWNYDAYVEDGIKFTSLDYYRRRFTNIWIATAFKGADGRTKMLPSLKARYNNNLNWLKIMFKYRYIYNFKGIMLTGWSRYGHMDPPCELLPVSMPSLTFSLLLTKKFKDGIVSKANYPSYSFYTNFIEVELKKELQCNFGDMLNLKYPSIFRCNTTGGNLMRTVYNYAKFLKFALNNVTSDEKGIYTVDFYYTYYNIVSPNSFSYASWANKSLQTLDNFTVHLSSNLLEFYDARFIKEYVNFNTMYLKMTLSKFHSILECFKTVKVWNHDSDQYNDIFNASCVKHIPLG